MKDAVDLVSTLTVDYLPLPDGSGVLPLPGGPATYIGQALHRLERPYTLITGDRAEVTVIPGIGGQEYLIPALCPIALPAKFTGAATIVSPIIGEVAPGGIPPAAGLLVIDLQGFVREPGRPTGEYSRQFDLEALLARADVVKASESEIGRLDGASREALGHTVLLNTLGAEGLVLRAGSKEHTVAARPVSATHTIGAGDTLLAGFVDALLDGYAPVEAARLAVDFTEEVLRERAPR